MLQIYRSNHAIKGMVFVELRVLQYFLAAARRNSISGTAEFLHLTQPTLSRQLKELKEKPGKQLFIREIEELPLPKKA